MMAGLALVEEQRLHLPRQPRRQVVAVIIEYAGARAIGGARIVGAAGGGLFLIGRHRADLEWGLRQGRELVGDAQFDLGLDREIAVAQRDRARGLEARARPQEGEELLGASLEADDLLLLVQFAPDARD